LPSYAVARIIRELEETTSDKGIEVKLARCDEQSFWDKLRNYIARLYPLYVKQLEETKIKKGKITVNDLIKYAVKILSDSRIAKHITSRLHYVFIDEAQDINHDQRRLTELLIEYGIKVFIVGDGKQSIYAFRGSDRAAFVALSDKVVELGGKVYTLKINYRSNKFIIEKINSLFSRPFAYNTSVSNPLNFDYESLEAKESADEGKGSIELVYGKRLKDLVRKYHIAGTNTAILCRTNREAADAFNELKDANIPADLFVSKSLYKTKAIIDFCKLLNYMIGGGELEKHELFYTDAYVAANAFKMTESEFFEEIDKAALTLKLDGIADTVSHLSTNLQILCYYEMIQDAQALANIEKLLEIIRNLQTDGMTSMEIIKYLNIMIATKQDEPQPKTHTNNSITVSTIHMYKGLDADTIIAYGIDSNLVKVRFADFYYTDGQVCFNQEELLPNVEGIEQDDLFEKHKHNVELANLEEEIRVMYVANTRAKNRLILCSKNSLDSIQKRMSIDAKYASYLRWILNK
jgi:ATP-dependent exoDNAse (exonuclease V) beta subunit